MPARVPFQDGWVCPDEQAILEQEEHFCDVLPHWYTVVGVLPTLGRWAGLVHGAGGRLHGTGRRVPRCQPFPPGRLAPRGHTSATSQVSRQQ